MEQLIQKALAGDPRSIAKLITLIEGESSFSQDLMKRIYPYSGKAHVIGVTGSPGAGKSTLVDKMITRFKNEGKKVGIIAVDPSSPFTGGAILGDRLRMQRHAVDPDVFIRSMGTRGSLGGVSRATHEAALILDACGKDIIVIETVGVGQSEVDIVQIADTVCLVLVPGMGDDVQIMKAGIMEIADIFVINKADREGADKIATEVNMMLDLAGQKAWRPPVLKTIAEQDEGIDPLIQAIDEHETFLSESQEGIRRRCTRLEREVEGILRREISSLVSKAWEEEKTPDIMNALLERKIDPYTLAEKILDRILASTDAKE